MKFLEFNNRSAQRVYNDYIARCKKALKILTDENKEECLLEINSHIYEYLEDHKTKDEMENLLNVLEKLGPPEETFKEQIAALKINQAVKTFNPKTLVEALFLNLQNGLVYILLTILFLFLLCFPLLIILKLIHPNHVGYFLQEGKVVFGFLSDTKNTTELLGNWFMPIALGITIVLYFTIIIILKTLKKNKS